MKETSRRGPGEAPGLEIKEDAPSRLPGFLVAEKDFRWRGNAVSRLEGITDAVFAFAMTLLVVSLEVPRNFDAFMASILQFPAFAVCFGLLVMIWYYHFKFHRRFGLEDFTTILLNSALLFGTLFFVFPLKFVFSVLVSLWLGIDTLAADGSHAWSLGAMEWRTLMLFYSGGIIYIFGILLLMNWHALRHGQELRLNPLERYLTETEIRVHAISMAMGVASCALALLSVDWVPYSGAIYFLLGPIHGIHGYWNAVRQERMQPVSGPA